MLKVEDTLNSGAEWPLSFIRQSWPPLFTCEVRQQAQGRTKDRTRAKDKDFEAAHGALRFLLAVNVDYGLQAINLSSNIQCED